MTFLLLTGAALVMQPPVARRLQPGNARTRPAGLLVVPVVFCGGLGCYVFGRVSVAVAVLFVVVCAVWYIRDVNQARQARRGREHLATFLGTVAADLRAGATTAGALQRGVNSVPAECPAAVRLPLQTAAGMAAHGGHIHAPLVEAADPAVVRLGHVIRMSTAHGVALANLIEQAQAQLDAARRHAKSTESSLQGPQATALILACLPLAGIAMGGAMGADSLSFLLGGGLGGLLLDVGVALACAGFAWSRYILRRAAA